MGIYKLKPEVYYAKTTDFYDRMAYLCENADTDLLYFPLSGIVAYFTKTTMNKVKEISYSLTRVGYKTLKMLGKDLLSKTGDLTSAASEGISTKVQISLSNTLLILSQIESKTQDINTMIKCLLLLEELYYSLDSDSKSKNLEIYCSLMKKLYNGIFSMTDSQKEFFFRVLMRVHRVLFVSKGMVQMGNEFVSIYSKKEEDNTAKPLTQMLQQSQTFSHSIYQIFM